MTREYFRELQTRKNLDQYDQYLNQYEPLNYFTGENSLYKAILEKVLHLELDEDNIDYFKDAVLDKLSGHELDVLVGGPPCQAYSLAGRSRDIHNKTKDPKHFLFRVYLKIIERLRPKFFLYENVPGLLTASTDEGETSVLFEKEFFYLKTPYIILPKWKSQENLFQETSFQIKNHIIDMSEYGVPQKRKRVLLIGVRKDIFNEYSEDLNNFWLEFKKLKESPVTCGHALSGLPNLKPGAGNNRRYDKGYNNEKFSTYAKSLKSEFGVLNHQARSHMKSDLKRYKYFIKNSVNGYKPTLIDLGRDHPELLPNHKNLNIFIDRFKVQVSDQPASTITAHLQKDGHYYIHPDIKQLRSLTVREAARIQGFPDDYFFEGNRGKQYKQVGNAVPPIFAAKLASHIRHYLDLFK